MKEKGRRARRECEATLSSRWKENYADLRWGEA